MEEQASTSLKAWVSIAGYEQRLRQTSAGTKALLQTLRCWEHGSCLQSERDALMGHVHAPWVLPCAIELYHTCIWSVELLLVFLFRCRALRAKECVLSRHPVCLQCPVTDCLQRRLLSSSVARERCLCRSDYDSTPYINYGTRSGSSLLDK